VVAEIIQSLRPSAQDKGLEIRVAMPSDPLIISTDRRALSQILINLANNAIKFTQEGSVRLVVSLAASDVNPRAIFQVIDTGVGIKEEDQNLLFEAFKQVRNASRRQSEGSGLGLHLSQKLAAVLGGEISLNSKYGAGSTFTLTLPA
jgi:signal transduction histidine kinase